MFYWSLWFFMPLLTQGLSIIFDFPPIFRIYTGAPKHTLVGKIRASTNNNSTSSEGLLPIVLYPGEGSEHFVVAGNKLLTSHKIAESPGTLFTIHIGAGNPGEEFAESKIDIEVTEYNKYAPEFSTDHLHVLLLRSVPLGSVIAHLPAVDYDVETYNQVVDYHLLATEDGLDPNEYLDIRDGYISVSKPVPKTVSRITAVVRASDNGSPKRESTASLAIFFTSLSAPTQVELQNNSFTAATFCWLAPDEGNIAGYIVESWIEGRPAGSVRQAYLEDTCGTIDGLKPESKYLTQISATNGDEVGLPSETIFFTTTVAALCPAELEITSYGSVEWPMSPGATEARIACPFGPLTGALVRTCDVTYDGLVFWTATRVERCNVKEVHSREEAVTRVLGELDWQENAAEKLQLLLLQKEVTSREEADKVLSSLQSVIAEGSDAAGPEFVANVMDMLNKTTDHAARDPEV